MHFTISWATSSGVSFSRSKVNSMAPLSLGFPFSFLGSSTHNLKAIVDFLPWSSSASSTLTPVSSAKKAWLSRSLISYLKHQNSCHTISFLGCIQPRFPRRNYNTNTLVCLIPGSECPGGRGLTSMASATLQQLASHFGCGTYRHLWIETQKKCTEKVHHAQFFFSKNTSN